MSPWTLFNNFDLQRCMSCFHEAFAAGVASQQGMLTLLDTWFRPPFWDLLVLQLVRPDSSHFPYLYSTFRLEYPLVLSRFCLFSRVELLFNVTCNDISVIYVTAHRYAGGLKKLELFEYLSEIQLQWPILLTVQVEYFITVNIVIYKGDDHLILRGGGAGTF